PEARSVRAADGDVPAQRRRDVAAVGRTPRERARRHVEAARAVRGRGHRCRRAEVVRRREAARRPPSCHREAVRQTRSMDSIVAALAEQQAELSGLLDPLDDAGWARPSPCEGWSVADVVLHLVQTNGMAQASLDDRYDEFLESMLVGARMAYDVDDGAAAMVERDRGMPNGELNERWRTEAAALTASFAAADPHKRVQWVVGQLSVR